MMSTEALGGAEMSMLRPVLGLTGRMASGKDLAAGILRDEFGLAVIDMDRLGHAALAALAPEIETMFGPGFRQTPSGAIDRAALGRIVFSDPAALRRLEALLHPWMVSETARILAQDQGTGCVINAAILHRMGLERFCTHIVFVDAPEEELIRRIMARNSLARDAALLRLARQEDVNRYRESADTVLENSGSPEEFAARVRAFAQNCFGSTNHGDAAIAVRCTDRTQKGPLYPQS
mgnify:CR=1 FL=1